MRRVPYDAMDHDISGFVAPGFEPVRAAFAQNFVEHGEVGAGVSIVHQGHLVVDLVGGVHPDGTTPYDASTLQLVFSSTKGAATICLHRLVEQGLVDLDAPIANYWPEFAAAGKAEVPVRWALTHQIGLPDIDNTLTLDAALDWDTVASSLAESAPMWEPGSQHGYHAVTFGWLIGEIVRRVSGHTLGTYFAKEIADPLDLEFWIGTPDEVHDRVSPVMPVEIPEGLAQMLAANGVDVMHDNGMLAAFEQLFGPGNLLGRALSAPGGAFADFSSWNRADVMRAELPAANGVTNARSLAKLYAATVSDVDGVRVLNADTVRTAIERQTAGPDAVLMMDIPFASGFMLDGMFSKLGSPTAFGHYGFGGSLGFADHAHGIGFGYVMNKTDLGLAGDPRTSGLIDAMYAVL